MSKKTSPRAASSVRIDTDQGARHPSTGLVLCLLTATLFAVSILISKFVYQHGVGPLFFGGVRAVFCIVICGIYIAIRGGEWLMPKPSRRYLVLMSCVLLCVSFGYPTAMKYISAGLATLLFYLWPILVVIFTAIHKRKFPGVRRTIIFLAAFLGLALVFGPSVNNVRWEGIAAALTAAVGAGLFFMLIPKITEHASSFTININTNILVGAALFMGAYLSGEFQVPVDPVGWYALALAGILYGVAMILIFYAVKLTDPVSASILFNTEPLIVTILAAVLFADVLEPLQYLGIIAVVGSVMFASARTAKSGL